MENKKFGSNRLILSNLRFQLNNLKILYQEFKDSKCSESEDWRFVELARYRIVFIYLYLNDINRSFASMQFYARNSGFYILCFD